MYVQENDLKQKETYTNKLNWKLKWNYDVIDDNKYPTINREFVDQTGIPLPKDEEHIIEENLNEENISAHNIAEENFIFRIWIFSIYTRIFIKICILQILVLILHVSNP